MILAECISKALVGGYERRIGGRVIRVEESTVETRKAINLKHQRSSKK